MAASGALTAVRENPVEGTSISLSGRTHVRSRSPRLAASGPRSNVGKGSRQNGSVTSGEGLALRAGTVGLGEEAGRTARTLRGRSEGERRARKPVGAPGRAAPCDWRLVRAGASAARGSTDATSDSRCLRTVTDRGNPTV